MRPFMKHVRQLSLRSFAVVALTFSTSALAVTAEAEDPIYQIDLNKTQILRLPADAGAIVVGNPSIADVTVHSANILMVVGRGFGETNLVILDKSGETMLDADLQVTSVTSSHGVRIFNGKSRESYTCVPFCQPSPVLGDNGAFVGANTGQGPIPSSQGAVFDTPISTDTPRIQQATTPGMDTSAFRSRIDPRALDAASQPRTLSPTGADF